MGKREQYIAKATPQFQAAIEGLEPIVGSTFPTAEEIFEWGMPGWRLPRKIHLDPGYKGTVDQRYVMILLASRKAGITLHLWNPADYHSLEHHRGPLEKAGFKVMVGCLQFNRKAPFPVAAVTPLLRKIKASAKV